MYGVPENIYIWYNLQITTCHALTRKTMFNQEEHDICYMQKMQYTWWNKFKYLTWYDIPCV